MKQSNLYSFFAVGSNKKRERDVEEEMSVVGQMKRNMTNGAAEKENSNPSMQGTPLLSESIISKSCAISNTETIQISESIIRDMNTGAIENQNSNPFVHNKTTTVYTVVDSSPIDGHNVEVIISEDVTSAIVNNDVIDDNVKVAHNKHSRKVANNELSDYELVRLENIRRNEEFLASLGLQGPSSVTNSVARVSTIKSTAPKAKQTNKYKNTENEILPTRRSARVASIPADANKYVADNVDVIEEDEDEEEKVEKIYDDSDVIRYVMDNNFNNISTRPKSDRIQYYHPINTENIVSSPDLPAIYSMEYHPQYFNMLLAGGKGGYVSLFKMPDSQAPVSDNSSNNLLFSWRAHNRWISTVKFLNDKSSHKVSVISAADDATVKIWDVGTRVTTTSSKANSITPQLLASYDSIHDKGVYSLDISPDQTKLVTGSKDKTIAVSSITESLISNTLMFNNLHHSVVKTVAFHTSDNNLIASGGQDRRVSIKDLRVSETSDIIIDNAHNGGVHTVFFNKNNAGNILVTAGFDAVINLFDIRNPQEPLHRLIGHHSSSTKTFKTILTPAIVTPSNTSEFIIATGEGSDMLSLYDVSNGKTISRGSCIDQPASIAVKHDGSNTIGLSFRSKSLSGSIMELQGTSEPL